MYKYAKYIIWKIHTCFILSTILQRMFHLNRLLYVSCMYLHVRNLSGPRLPEAGFYLNESILVCVVRAGVEVIWAQSYRNAHNKKFFI